METSNENINETQLSAREGIYQLVTQAEYCRPKVGGINSYAGPNSMLVGGGVNNNIASGHVTQDGITAGGANLTTGGTSSIVGAGGATNQGGGGGAPLAPIKISFTKVATMMINPGASPISSATSTSPSATGTKTTSEGVARQNQTMVEHEAIDIIKKVNLSPEKENAVGKVYRNQSWNSEDRPQLQQERIIINIGRELFVFNFNGIEPADLSKLIDRRVYKLTLPTCHDVSTCPSLSLILIGFSSGQVQLLDLNQADVNKFYNQERLIEKTRVTCVRWLPRSKANFLVSHASGQMYLYKEDLTCGNTAPTYQQYKQGPGFAIYSCKSKSQRNPIFKWSIGIHNGTVALSSPLNGAAGSSTLPSNGIYDLSIHPTSINGNMGTTNVGGGQTNAINEFAFSPCGNFLAVVSQDGFLRVFDYDQMDLIGTMRSYFGGLLCLAWSSDSRLIATGGEDDLITIWSVAERRVLARGQGHKSWVNAVAFDAYMTSFNDVSMVIGKNKFIDTNDNKPDNKDLDEEKFVASQHEPIMTQPKRGSLLVGNGDFYRLGSVGQDTQICLWDITEDIIGPSIHSPLLIGCRANRMSAQNWTNESKRQSLSNVSEASDKSSSTTTDKTLNSATSVTSTTKLNQNGSIPNLFSTESSSPSLTPPAKEEKEKKRFFFKVGSSKTLEKPHKSSTLSTGLSSRSFSENHNKRATASHSKATGEAAAAAIAGTPVGQLKLNDPTRLLGTPLCPRIDDVPMLEPHVIKKVAHERLTSIVFRREAIVIGNQDGRVMVFARPKKETNATSLGR